MNPTLHAASREWARYSVAQGVSNHDSPAKVDASCAAAASDAINCGELVGRTSGSATNVIAFMKGSPGHSASMLYEPLSHVGAGAVVDSNGHWYVVIRLMHSDTAESAERNDTPTTTTTRVLPPGGTPTTTTPSAPVDPAAERFVRSVSVDFLGRQPTVTELASWSIRVETQMQREIFVRTYAYSTEYIGVLIDRYYRIALGRSADAAGKAHWAEVIRRGQLTPAQVAASSSDRATTSTWPCSWRHPGSTSSCHRPDQGPAACLRSRRTPRRQRAVPPHSCDRSGGIMDVVAAMWRDRSLPLGSTEKLSYPVATMVP